MNLISVIVPIYNTEKYLSQCLDSILSSTYQNLEIILIDNNSKDNSLNICYEYLKKDHRISIYQEYKPGVSAARNLGLRKSTGDYILFVDSDDYIESNHIASLYSAFCRTKADIIISGLKEYDVEMKILYKPKFHFNQDYLLTNEQAISDMVYEHNFKGFPVAKLYKKSVLENIYFDENEKIGEDFSFNCMVIKNSHKICLISDSSYCYIRRSGTLTKSNDIGVIKQRAIIIDKYRKFINMYFPNLKNSVNYFSSFININILNGILDVNSKDYNDVVKNLRGGYFRVLFNFNVSLKFKIKLILSVINVPLYGYFRKLYLKN